MKLRHLLSISLLATVAVTANAQVKGRSFTYSSTEAIDQDFTKSGDFSLKVSTRVIVNPYLYVKGNLGAEWIVDGWGVGTDTQKEALRFYHNETLTFDFDGFENPEKVSGTKTGAQNVNLAGMVEVFNDQNSKGLFSTEMGPIAGLNSIFKSSGPNFLVAATDGLLRLEITRKISILPQVGPGVYENVGVINVIRN